MPEEDRRSMRWKPYEEERLKSFLLVHKQSLLLNMYKNIIQGELRYRRETKLFHEMSKFVGRTSLQCKSKMQKFERHAYVSFLGVRSSHYDVFEWLRKKRSLKMKLRRRKRVKNLQLNDGEMETKRQEIVERLTSGELEIEGESRGFL